MRRLYILLAAVMTAFSLTAQTLTVTTGNGSTQIDASQVGTMTYNSGDGTLTIGGTAYAVSDISKMTVTVSGGNTSSETSRTVAVAYNGSSATVSVSSDIANYVTVSQSGAHVSIVQSDDVADEITYTLSGSSSDGEFYMEGSYKATVELNGLTLTNTNPVMSGAALHIQNGKRINIKVVEGTVNTLADAAGGSQKGCLYVKGHAEFKQKGTLNIVGNTSHAIKAGEYVSVKNATINVTSAVGDGINCNEYFLMESGTVSISGTGDDGIQCDVDGDSSTGETTDHEDEDSGNIYLEGGTLTVKVTVADTKGIKSAGDLKISDGTVSVTHTGKSSSSAASKAIKSEGSMIISGGTITASSSSHEAIESKGTLDISGGYIYATASDDAINAASHLTISGGYVMANSTGNDGIDANGNLYIKGGNVFAIATSQPEVGLDANTEGRYQLYITGGNVVAIGGFESGASISGGTAQQTSYSKGTWYALYNGSDVAFAFKVPSNSSMGASMAVYTVGTPGLKSGVTASGSSFWEGNGATSASGGSDVSLSSYSGGGGNIGGGGGPGGGGPGGGFGGGGFGGGPGGW